MSIFNWFKKRKHTCIDFSAGYNLTDLPITTFYQGEVKLNFLLDTGSNNNIINESALKDIKYSETNRSANVYGMDGVNHSCSFYTIDIEYQGFHCPANFMVCNMETAFGNIKRETGVTIHGILGSRFFKECKSILDFSEFKAYFKKQ